MTAARSQEQRLVARHVDVRPAVQQQAHHFELARLCHISEDFALLRVDIRAPVQQQASHLQGVVLCAFTPALLAQCPIVSRVDVCAQPSGVTRLFVRNQDAPEPPPPIILTSVPRYSTKLTLLSPNLQSAVRRGGGVHQM